MAQANTYSGRSNAQMNNGRRRSANDSNGFRIHFSIQPFGARLLGDGTFGWRATQVHDKTVIRQLQIMFQIDLQWEMSVQWFAANKRLSAGETGLASIETH